MVFDFQGFLPKSSEAQQKLKHTKWLLCFATWFPKPTSQKEPPTLGLQKPEVPDTVEKSWRLPVEVGSLSGFLWGILSILRYPWDLFFQLCWNPLRSYAE